MDEGLKKKIYLISNTNNYKDEIPEIFIDFYKDMEKKDFIKGGCHFLSSVLHVVFSEFDIQNELCIGNVKFKEHVFSHSWIEIRGKEFDIAISDTNNPLVHLDGIVFGGIDTSTMLDASIYYGVNPDKDLKDKTGKRVMDLTLGEYFNMAPVGKNFVWDYVLDFSKNKGKFLNTRRLKEKYSDEKWIRK